MHQVLIISIRRLTEINKLAES